MLISSEKNMLIKHNKQRHFGFTLIEMMFIVLLLAFIGLQIAQSTQQRSEANIIEKSAGDMNDWEVAILNYYNHNNSKWPASLSAVTTTTPALMPATALCSQFIVNNPGSNPQCGSYAEYNGFSQSNYYVLSIQTNSANTAVNLAARLQNAWITNNTTVNTAIPAPSAIQGAMNRGWIVSAGLVTFSQNKGGTGTGFSDSLGSQIYLPNCPKGFEGHLLLSPEQYDSNGTQWGIHIAEVTPTGGQVDSAISSTSVIFPHGTDHYGNQAYAITTNDIPDNSNTSNAGGIRHLAFYMTICVPYVMNSNGSFNHSNWNTNFVNSDWLQDGECSTSWNQYLNKQGNTSPNCVNTTSNKFVYPLLGTATGD